MSLWQKYEDLVLEFMESRVAEILDQGAIDSPKVIANVRETAAWTSGFALLSSLRQNATSSAKTAAKE
jgi:hypothetical protein